MAPLASDEKRVRWSLLDVAVFPVPVVPREQIQNEADEPQNGNADEHQQDRGHDARRRLLRSL